MSCLTLETLWTVAHQAPLSMGFSRQEDWSGLPFASPGALPNPGIEPRSCALHMVSCIAGRFFTEWATSSVQFSLVNQSCPTLCDPMDHSMPGFPIHHQLPEFTQTHVHWVGDATQPSHPLSSPSPPIFNLSQHQGLFKWVGSSHQVTKVLEFQLQHQSVQWTPKTNLL